MSDKKEKKQVSIELPEELAHGFYSNLAVVNHSPTEFVVDFISMMPGMPKASDVQAACTGCLPRRDTLRHHALTETAYLSLRAHSSGPKNVH